MDNDWKKRLGVVYSTREDFQYESEGTDEVQEILPPDKQQLTVSLDRKNRKGKAVTLITGYSGPVSGAEALGQELKKRCGVGGSVKDHDILLQGDHRDKVIQLLRNSGFRVKKSGG